MARKALKNEKNISYDDEKKKYYVCFDYGKDESGKRKKQYKTFSTKEEAIRARNQFQNDNINGTVIQPSKMTVQDYLSQYIENIRPSSEKTTIYGYEQILKNHIYPALGKYPLQELKPMQIQAYYTDKTNEGKLSQNTLRKHHDLLKAAFKMAVQQEIMVRNPCDHVKPPKNTKAKIQFYSVEQLKTLLEKVRGDRLELIVVLAAFLGLRREEICGLQWKNVDFEKSTLTIDQAITMAGSQRIEKTTKSFSSIRELYIPESVMECLKREKERQEKLRELAGIEPEDDLVVVMADGKKYRPNYISELFTKFIEDNDLPKITLHGLRHTFATIANSLGGQLYDISKAMGHSNTSVTSGVYTHLLDPNHKELIEEMDKAIREKK